jgi:hypothetical protein
MASPVRLYQSEIYNKFSCFATWLPGDQIEVGDVGIIEGGRFRRRATLEELGIPCKPIPGETTNSIRFESSRGAKIEKTAGAVVQQVAQLGVSIVFSRKGAFVFHASNLRHHRLDDPATVADGVVKLYEAKSRRWKREWFLVDEFHSAECATIIVSEVGSSSISLDASAGALVSGSSLADPRLGLKVAAESGKVIYVLAKAGVRPLYSCAKVKHPYFSEPSVESYRTPSYRTPQPFTRPGLDILLDS